MKHYRALLVAGLLFAAGSLLPRAVDAPPRGVWRNLSPAAWLFQGVPLSATYTPTPIQSLQQISITVGSGSNSNTAALSPTVTAANAILLSQGTNTDSGNSSLCTQWLKGAFTSGSVITATKGGACTASIDTYKGVVVEFIQPFVKSSNCGSITIANNATSNTAATLASVNTAKTIVSNLGANNDLNATDVADVYFLTTVVLTNANTITATRQGVADGTTALSVGYCYLEFK